MKENKELEWEARTCYTTIARLALEEELIERRRGHFRSLARALSRRRLLDLCEPIKVNQMRR